MRRKSLFGFCVLVCIAALTALFTGRSSAAEVFANSSDLSDQRDRVGRDFRSLSIHPNGIDIAIVECSFELVPQGNCYLVRYNRVIGQLWRYVFPDDYLVTEASFSPRGNFLVMSRQPRRADDSDGAIRQQVEHSQIAFMRTNGSEFNVLGLSAGHKVGPAMSPDERKIAYWRGAVRPPGSKSFAANHDIWEVTLDDEQDKLFAGPFHFFERSNLQYIDSNKLLVGAYGPRGRDIFEYTRKYKNSAVYFIERDVRELPPPSFTDVEYARRPSADTRGGIYFECQIPNVGMFFCRKNADGSVTRWQQPRRIEAVVLAAASPTGAFLLLVGPLPRTNARDSKRELDALDTESGEWKAIRLPSLSASMSIDVKPAH